MPEKGNTVYKSPNLHHNSPLPTGAATSGPSLDGRLTRVETGYTVFLCNFDVVVCRSGTAAPMPR